MLGIKLSIVIFPRVCCLFILPSVLQKCFKHFWNYITVGVNFYGVLSCPASGQNLKFDRGGLHQGGASCYLLDNPHRLS